MDIYSTDSSTLGGPSQFHTGKSKKSSNFISSFDKLNESVSREIKVIDTPANCDTELLRIDPPEVTFDTVELGVRYVMNVSVRNVTKSAQRIRFSAPKTPAFSINYIPAGAVAPGLDVVAEIECQLDDNSENFIFTDAIVVSMGMHKIEIPLVCRKPCPDVVFNPFLSLGLVPQNQTTVAHVSFENRGSAPAQVMFKPMKFSKLIVEPLRAIINCGEHLSVQVRHDCKEIGPLRELVDVSVNGLPQNMILDISGQVVNQKLSLLAMDGKGSLEQVDFGTLFYGHSKEVKAVLVNSGPVQVNYTVSYPDESDTDGSPAERPMVIFPPDGTLEPFSQIPLTLRFRPTAPNPKKAFAKQYINELSEALPMAMKASIDVLDMGDQQAVSVAMMGAAVIPTFKLSPTTLRFGTCPMNDRRDILMTLQNLSPVSMKFNFSTGAQYKITPCSGVANPGQTMSIVASYLPCQLGTTKKVCTFSVEGGLRTADVRIVGECVASDIEKKTVGGIDKVPEDFQKNYKFVDPTESTKLSRAGDTKSNSKFQRVKPWDSQEFLSSTSWDEVYSGCDQPQQSANNDPATYSLQELQRRSHHKSAYTDFVRKSYANRVANKAERARQREISLGRPDRSDPDGVDMGMERGLGDGPVLKSPVADEPLWLANRHEKGDKKNFQFDENRLIIKKSREAPSTQAEQRDCATELTAEQLRSVVASHKIINFGKVCVNSINVKNFAVTNELQQMIIVKLSSMESELRQSKPMSQIVAANGTVIGFDIHFVCRQVCKYKKTFSWSINDVHNFKVTVLADVVPIEVLLDKQSLTMEFSPDSMEKSHTDRVVMTNPGNAVAEFVWGNRGAFKCVPEQGNLHPGQSMVVTVNWTPGPGLSHHEDISLIVTGGTEQVLSLTGMLTEGQLAFDDKKLHIGTMAVGAERRITTSLRNIGSSPAVFFFGSIPANYHIVIKPERGRLNPDESIDVTILVKPMSRTHYDNKSISVTTRGGKPINLKLSGEAIVPKVHLEEERFSYGHVVTGSRELLPFTLINSGTIDSVLYLDFNSFPDFIPVLGSSDENTLSSTTVFEDNEGNILEHMRQADGASKKWRLVIGAGLTMRGYIKFSPTVAKLHNFKLPLTVQGLPADTSLSRPVIAEGLLSRLHVSSYTIDFHDRVVARDPSSRMSYFEEVTFKNVDISAGLTYEIRELQDESSASTVGKAKKASSGMPGDDQPVFFVSPMRGDLSPGESSTMRVTFLPKCNGDFFKILQIYISEQPDPTRPYFTLTVRGSGVYPRLSFSEQRLMLPPVPLNVTSRCVCTIYNQGYDNIELRYRVSPTIPVSLHITFPGGSELGLTRAKTTVIISARSDRPESWTGKIEFYDNDGEKFFLEVSGCFDCSLITSYPFVRDYSDKYGFLGLDNQPIRYCTKKELAFLKAEEVKQKALNRKKALESQGSFSSLPSDSQTALSSARKARVANVSDETSPAFKPDEDEGVDITRVEPAEGIDTEGDIKMLLRWLNAFICRKPFDVDNYLDNIVSTGGDIVVDCLEQLSGKKIGLLISSSQNRVPGGGGEGDNKHDGDGPSSMGTRLNHVNKMMTKYVNLLQFLTRSGCLVLHISPASLLDLESCILSREIELKKTEGVRLTQAMLKDRRESWERRWRLECGDSWSEILFQGFKVFVLSRITYKDYIETPGVVVQSALASESKDSQKDKSRNVTGKSEAKRKKTVGPKCPPELVGSNIFSQAEAVVLTWVSYHQLRAGRLPDAGDASHPNTLNPRMPSMNRRIVDPGAEFSDFFAFCQVIHSHVPDTANSHGTLAGYTFTEPNEKLPNFERFCETLNALRINFGISMQELSSSSRCMIIMAAHLFLNLPHLLPKTTIEFRGSLSTPIPKTIELKNPSKKMVTYDVTLEGPADFMIESRTVILEPGTVTGFNISCTPSFSKPAQGRLTFWGIREGGVGGSNIVFDLVTKVTDRPPVRTVKKNIHLFDHDMTEIEVSNPFNHTCTFSVQILQQFYPIPVQQLFGHQAKVANTHRKNSVSGTNQAMQALLNEVSANSETTARDDEEVDARRIFKDPCWCNETSLTLTANESKKITVHSLPFQMGTCSCQVVLVEPNTGEICYEVMFNIALPNPVEELSFESPQLGEGDAIQKVLRVASSNSLFEKAVTLSTDSRLALNRRAKARLALQNMLTSTVSNEDTGQSQFAVEIDNPYFNTQKEFGVVCNSSGGGGATGRASTASKKYTKVLRNGIEPYAPSESTANSLPFSFFPEKAGVYRAMVVMYSLSNQQDIRVLIISAKITPSMTELSLVFAGPARQKIIQEIPLRNESEQDWNLQASVQGRCFSVPKSVLVPAGNLTSFPVSFQGQHAGKYEATLYLKNVQNIQDSFEFKLRGDAEDPLAEAALMYKCRARYLEKFVIKLPNNTGADQLLTVETDLQYLCGADEVLIGLNGGTYEFSVNCPVGGVMTGSITFREKNSEYMVWYTVEIEVTSPAAESTIEAESEVRKAVAIEISLENPTDDDLHFEVALEGDGLLGDNTFVLRPNSAKSSNSYELIYSPLKAGNFTGSITFMNDVVGEFWYKVLLTAHPAGAVEVDTVECMIGLSKSVAVPVENPLDIPIVLTATIGDNSHFAIHSGTISLGPYAQSTFEVTFCPSSFNDIVSTEIVLSNDKLGDLLYAVSGKGLLPGIMPVVNIAAPTGEIGSHTILFRNPFSHPLPVDVVLSEEPSHRPENDADHHEDRRPLFALLLRKASGIVVASNSTLQVAISFSPEKLGDYHATVEFRSSISGRSLLWCSPICGIAEAGVPIVLPKLSTACKTSILREIEVPLEGLLISDIGPKEKLTLQDFSVEISPRDSAQRALITRNFRIQALCVVTLTCHDDEPHLADFAIRYRLLFEPLRVFNADLEIIVVCKDKGRWRAEIHLEALDPDPDDVIALQAAVGEIDKVSFKLTNRFLGYSPYEAYFTARSSPHFSISPSSGVLAPFGSAEGTQFVVTYAPREYGMRETATLIVSTAEAQWNYKIVGTYPDFFIDRNAVKSKVDSGRG